MAAVAPRRALVGGAVRHRAPGLARRVLRDVDARAAHHHPRPARRRYRPHLPAPRVRGRAERELHGRAVLALLAPLGDGPVRGREDVEVAREPRVRERPAEGRRPARHPPRAHAPPVPVGLRVARHRPRRGHRAAAPPPRRRGALRRCRSAPFASGCAPRSTTTSTRPRRSKRSTTWRRGPVGRRRRLGAGRAARARRRCSASTSAGRSNPVRAAEGGGSFFSMADITITLPNGSTREYASPPPPATSPRPSAGPRQGGGGGHGRRRGGRPQPADRPRRRPLPSSPPTRPTAARCCGTPPRT